MRSTPQALLSRVRNLQDHEAWREFDALYRRLLISYCRRRGVPDFDAEDLVQLIFIRLTRSLPQFIYDPQRGKFRYYLFRCARNAIAEWAAKPNRRLEPPVGAGGSQPDDANEAVDAAADDARLWEEEWVAHHYRLAIDTIRTTADPTAMAIFERSIAGEKAASLAAEFAMSEPAVYKIRQRIRDRLKQLIERQVRDEDRIDEPGR